MSKRTHVRRVIEVNKNLIGPTAPREKTVQPRKLKDYPQVAAAHRDVARKLSSPLLMGPPICDEFIAFIEHTFTEEEAGAARHLSAVKKRTVYDIARAEHRSVEQIAPILERLAFEKRAIACRGPREKQLYHLMPVMPGMFEMVLIGESPWTCRKRFSRISPPVALAADSASWPVTVNRRSEWSPCRSTESRTKVGSRCS